MNGLADKLDLVRQAAGGCRLAAFGDLHTEVILLASSTSQKPREYLDVLSAEAAQVFSAHDQIVRSNTPLVDPAGEATVLTPDEVRLYLRSPCGAPEFLCLVCDDTETGKALVPKARALLETVAGVQDA